MIVVPYTFIAINRLRLGGPALFLGDAFITRSGAPDTAFWAQVVVFNLVFAIVAVLGKRLREAGITRTQAKGTERLITLRRDDLDERFPGLVDVLTRG